MKTTLAVTSICAVLAASGHAVAAEPPAPAADNLGAVSAIAAQSGAEVYRDRRTDRRNAAIALTAVAVGAAVALGAFDSSDSHDAPSAPPTTPPPTHDG